MPRALLVTLEQFVRTIDLPDPPPHRVAVPKMWSVNQISFEPVQAQRYAFPEMIFERYTQRNKLLIYREVR